ncbi:MAG: HlyC/CorC family transporter [Phycisphaerales bacterium]|nr:HlyC/CorC family transporter [Phycisphaerales bacterium]
MPALELMFSLLMLPMLVGSAFCSATETALFSLRQEDRLRMRKIAPEAAGAVATLLVQPRPLLVMILVGNTAMNAAYFTLASVVTTLLSGLWAAGFAVGSVLLLIALGEIVPKTLATGHRVLYCTLFARPLLTVYRIAAPVRYVAGDLIVTPLSRLFRPAGAAEHTPLTVEELSSLLAMGAKQGVLESDEQRLLGEVVSLHTLRVRDVMTPRMRLAWIGSGATVADLLALCQRTGHTKFPVRADENEGPPTGFINAQRLLPALNRDPEVVRSQHLGRWIEPPRFVPERARLDQLLEHFRTTRSDISLCVSESGDVTGLVGMEDLVDELIAGGNDTGDEGGAMVRTIAPGQWEVSGAMNVHDWSEIFGSLGRRDGQARVSTVGGIIIAALGRLPRPGDEVERAGMRLRVLSMSGRSVGRVGVTLIKSVEPGAAGEVGA